MVHNSQKKLLHKRGNDVYFCIGNSIIIVWSSFIRLFISGLGLWPTSMLATDVGDEICWCQLKEIGDALG